MSTTCLDHFEVTDIDKANVDVLEHQEFSDHYSISLSFPIKQKLEEGFEIFRGTSFSKSSDVVDNFLFMLNHRLKNF